MSSSRNGPEFFLLPLLCPYPQYCSKGAPTHWRPHPSFLRLGGGASLRTEPLQPAVRPAAAGGGGAGHALSPPARHHPGHAAAGETGHQVPGGRGRGSDLCGDSVHLRTVRVLRVLPPGGFPFRREVLALLLCSLRETTRLFRM